MPVVIKNKVSIESCDGKKVWNVPNKLILDIDGTKYIKLPRSHVGFASLVMHHCNTLPEESKEPISLTASLGYQKLLELRNAEQSCLLAQPMCRLFKAVPKKRTKSRISRDKAKEMRSSPEVLSLQLVKPDGSPWAMNVLKPVCARDDIAVELEPDVIQDVITFLQHAGWDTSLSPKKKQKTQEVDSNPADTDEVPDQELLQA